MHPETRHLSAQQWNDLQALFDEAINVRNSELDALIYLRGIDPPVEDKLRKMVRDYRVAAEFFSQLGSDISELVTDKPYVEVGDLLEGRFRIRRFIARGGMGEVYEAEDTELGGKIAVKVMRPGLAAIPGSLERFREEVRLAREVSSPHVCRVHDVARHTDLHKTFLFLKMELLDGETLLEQILQSGPLPLARARELICQMIRGISAAHAGGVLHRDLKSSNVIVCATRDSVLRAVITDFGLSRSLRPETTPSLCGLTPDYSAPELLLGHEATIQTDVFAFGVVMYEIVTGRLPFEKTSVPTARELVTPRTRRPDLPLPWEKIILKCLDPDPSKRFLSFPELGDQFGCDLRQGVGRRSIILGASAAAAVGTLMWRGFTRSSSPGLFIAIFPLAAPPELQYSADGLSDRIADGLGRVPGARVISRFATQRLPSRGTGPTQARSQLKAAFALTGTFQGIETNLRVHLELNDTTSGALAWSSTYDTDETQLMLLPDQALRGMVPVLSRESGPELYAELGGDSKNPEAYQAYLLGRYYADKRDVPSLRESVKYLERSTAIDDSYANAFAALALSYFQLAFKDSPTLAQNIDSSRKAAERALKIDPRCAEAHMVFGDIQHWWNWDWDVAEDSFRRAIQINPSLPQVHHWYSRMLYPLGRFEEATREIETARDLDPLNFSLRIARGMIMSFAGKVDEAIQDLKLVIASDPGSANAYVPLSVCLEWSGRIEEALEAARKAVINSGRESFAIAQLGRLFALSRRDSEARPILEELVTRFSRSDAYPTEIAGIYSAWADVENTLGWLEKGIDVHDINLQLIRVDPGFRFLATHTRFVAVAERVFGKKRNA